MMVTMTEGIDQERDLTILRQDLEKQELEALKCRPDVKVYTKLLAIYLQQNNLCNAKFLWKRIPEDMKKNCPELGKVWEIGQYLWKGEYSSTFSALQSTDWSPDLKELMTCVTLSVRRRSLHLVSSAYSTISPADFSKFVGLPENDALALVNEQEGWSYNQEDNFIHINPQSKSTNHTAKMPSEEQLSQLTNFISFLEK